MWSMKWQMRWRNKSAATINTTLQLLDIYRLLNWSLPNIFTTISPSLSSHVRVPWSMDLSHFFRTIYTFYLCSSVMVALIFFFFQMTALFFIWIKFENTYKVIIISQIITSYMLWYVKAQPTIPPQKKEVSEDIENN